VAGGTSGGTSGAASGTTGGDAGATGSTSGGSANVNIASEQRTQITQSFRSVDAEPITDVTFNISVGTVVPTSVTPLYDCPDTVARIVTGLPEFKYIFVRDQVVIVEPSTRRIVTVIERRG
jgi:hypothetical protein